MQSSLTAPLVKEVMDAAGLNFEQLDAVCVSKGPGSYTGLRVGVSTAKGIAFGAGIPLLAIDTLDILAHRTKSSVIPSESSVIPSEVEESFIVPMIDARRMEVYTAVYSAAGERLTEVEAKIVDGDSFAEYLNKGTVLFIGDGALKCREVITSPHAQFEKAVPLAADMAPLAQQAFLAGRFEDIAYFEPFYLKDFVATKPKNFLGI